MHLDRHRLGEELGSVMVSAGTAFTCTAGHYIGRAARDMRLHELVTGSMFADLQGPPLETGDRFGFCTCGVVWAAYGAFHTAAGWAPRRPDRLDRLAAAIPRPGSKRHGPPLA